MQWSPEADVFNINQSLSTGQALLIGENTSQKSINELAFVFDNAYYQWEPCTH
jgi:hypothetical protein